VTSDGRRHGRLFDWVSRKPKTAFWVVAGVAFVVGAVLGAAGSSDQDELDKKDARIKSLEGRVASVTGQRNSLEGDLGTARGRVKELSAKGEVPDFTGDSVDSAEDLAADYKWKLKVSRQVSGTSPGTVIAQQPAEGTTLKAGRSIRLVIAKKAPPKPPQWVTIRTLSGAGGQSKSDEFEIPTGKVRLLYNMPGEGNNAITLYKAPDEYVDLLVNEIGPQDGQTRVYTAGTYYLDVTGDSYTVQVQHYKRP